MPWIHSCLHQGIKILIWTLWLETCWFFHDFIKDFNHYYCQRNETKRGPLNPFRQSTNTMVFHCKLDNHCFSPTLYDLIDTSEKHGSGLSTHVIMLPWLMSTYVIMLHWLLSTNVIMLHWPLSTHVIML